MTNLEDKLRKLLASETKHMAFSPYIKLSPAHEIFIELFEEYDKFECPCCGEPVITMDSPALTKLNELLDKGVD